MTRDAPRNRGAIIRRLQAALDERAGDFDVTPAFSARVQRLRRRRRVVRQTTGAFAVAAIVVVLAVVAVNALQPANRLEFVSPTATESPSPSETGDTVAPSPSASEVPSETPSETPSEPQATEAQSEPESESPPETLTGDTPLDLYGIGPIEAGMTLGEAELAAGVDLVPQNFEDFGGVCYHATAEGLEEDFVIGVRAPGEAPVDRPEDGIVSSVVVHTEMASPARTLSGVGIGATEQEVYDTYPGQIESAPHEYIEDGRYLTLVPRDASDQEYGVKFATDGQVVREIHTGFADAIRAVEGCA